MKISLTALLCFFCSIAGAQTLIYDGYMKGHKVGEMKVVKEVSDERTVITTETTVEAHMLVKILVEYNSKSTYMNNRLVESEAKSHTNGNLKSSVQTVWKDGTYHINDNGDSKQLSHPELIGADYYYFEIPDNNSKALALATGELLTIEKSKPLEYYFEHDGKKELHLFDESHLKEVTISHKLYSITFKRRY
ncbi:DUF6134 family protein [Roseivirga pacifica]|uniref:DUF6134 family protein n=1 Tax=Roseivirga pacifica TaxID=1267423 RepID=UPI003BAFC6B6